MLESGQGSESSAKDRRRRLAKIVIAHLLVVGAFFVASFIWGNFA